MKRILSLALVLMLALSAMSLASAELSEYSQQIDLSVDYPVFWQDDISFPLVEEPMEISVMFPRGASHAEDFSDISVD